MRLLFDLRCTQPNDSGKRHGGGRYGEVIFFRMAELGLKFHCFYDSSLWFSPDVKAVIEKNKIPLIDCHDRSLQSIVDENKFDRVYSCCALRQDVAHLKNCEVYITVHDTRRFQLTVDPCFWDYKNSHKTQLKYLVKSLFPKTFEEKMKRDFKKLHIDTKLKINTVSDHSKYSFPCFLPELKDADIPAFYSPSTSDYVDMHGVSSSENKSTGKYFLSVSGNRWEKNNARGIKAFDRLIDCGLIKGVRYKVTGAKRDNFRFNIKHPEAFDFLGYVSDQELEQLYQNAYLFVYPSLNEGFGYPPLEAMRYKVPVIASPISSMAEILDSGALFFNPFSVEEIMNRMLMMMEPERHKEFSERGYKQYLKISERQRRDLDGVINYILSEK